MSGQLVEKKSFIVSSAGDNLVLTPKNGKLKVFSVLFHPNADITGEVTIKLGDRIIAGARNPKTGAIYGFNEHPDFVEGLMNAKLYVTLPSATAVTVDVAWREAPFWAREVGD